MKTGRMNQLGGYGHCFKIWRGFNCGKQDNENILEVLQKF